MLAAGRRAGPMTAEKCTYSPGAGLRCSKAAVRDGLCRPHWRATHGVHAIAVPTTPCSACGGSGRTYSGDMDDIGSACWSCEGAGKLAPWKHHRGDL